MYSEEKLIDIAKLRQSLRDKYIKRRKLRNEYNHHGAYVRIRLTAAILGIPPLFEIYFWETIGFSFIVSLPIAIWYWKSKTIFVKRIERDADEIRFEIVKIESRLKKEFSLIYESYEDFLYSSNSRRRFSVQSNVFFDDVSRNVSEREIDEDWL